MEYQTALFIFRRDLRLADNTALNEAFRRAKTIIPCFIFDPRQIGDNPYRSEFALDFLVRSLSALDDELHCQRGGLVLLAGEASDVIRGILDRHAIDAVFVNYDYTPFSRARDAEIRKACLEAGRAFHAFHDALIHPPGTVTKADSTPYTVFSPFMRKARELDRRTPATNIRQDWAGLPEEPLAGNPLAHRDVLARPESFRRGGRAEAIGILSGIEAFRNYDKERNFPAKAATSGLSPHLKFGTISVRELYAKICETFSNSHPMVSELYWRDFFTHIAFHFPYVFRGAFRPEYDQLEWQEDSELWERFTCGMTGFPIVDAGIRELRSTGFMHNRVRMIVASFLTKDLRISWQEGERFFAQFLVDYDPAVNNGNWQWAASTGCDAQPFFRIFNPWLQQQRYDPETEYIRRWVSELAAVPSEMLHALAKTPGGVQSGGYPCPIVDHAQAKSETLAMFRKAREARFPR